MSKLYDDAALAHEYEQCRRLRIVAQKYGCSDETVRRAAIKYGVERVRKRPKTIKRPKADEQELRLIVNEYYNTDVTINDLAKKYHRSQCTVSAAINKYGDGLKVCVLNAHKVTDEELREACKTLTITEIAEKYSMHPQSLPRRFKRLGIRPVGYGTSQLSGLSKSWGRYNDNLKKGGAKKENPFGESWHYIKADDVLIKTSCHGYSYIESRIVKRIRYIKMRCIRCGNAIIRQRSTVRRHGTQCDRCKENSAAKQKKAQSARALCCVLNALAECKKPKTCEYCGKEFYSQYSNAKYCSKRCKRKATGKGTSSIRGRCKKYGVYYDPTVTRKRVLERDNYTCQICGKICNPNDTTWGAFGPDFPTIDHIIPLAKGGTHTIENTQCACAMCNSYKRDLITA